MSKEIISRRYRSRRVKNHLSSFWKEIYKEKEIFNMCINKNLGNGTTILLWQDR
jgi:hypothetical protein